MSDQLYTDSGINWKVLERNYNRRLDEEEARGLQPIERKSERELAEHRARKKREANKRHHEKRRQREAQAKGVEYQPLPANRAPRQIIPEEEIQLAIELYKQGASIVNISRAVGRDKGTVRTHLIKRGVHVIGQRKGGTPPGLRKDPAPAVKLREEGWGISDISRKLEIPQTTVRRMLEVSGKL